MRRNSPRTGLPSISSAIFCERSPSATAMMTRATSVVGLYEVADERVERVADGLPAAAKAVHPQAFAHLAVASDDARDARELQGGVVETLGEIVEGLRRPRAPTPSRGRSRKLKSPRCSVSSALASCSDSCAASARPRERCSAAGRSWASVRRCAGLRCARRGRFRRCSKRRGASSYPGSRRYRPRSSPSDGRVRHCKCRTGAKIPISGGPSHQFGAFCHTRDLHASGSASRRTAAGRGSVDSRPVHSKSRSIFVRSVAQSCSVLRSTASRSA